MIPRRTLLITVAAALAVPAGLSFVLGRWTAGDLTELVHEVGFSEALAERLAVARKLGGGKHQAVDDLIAGRITLPQAVERFRRLNALVEASNGLDGVAPYVVASGEEALWRNVLAWVKYELFYSKDPGAAGVLPRLKAEYRERFGHDPELEAAPGIAPPSGPTTSPYPDLAPQVGPVPG
jgi:hypothetical protein